MVGLVNTWHLLKKGRSQCWVSPQKKTEAKSTPKARKGAGSPSPRGSQQHAALGAFSAGLAWVEVEEPLAPAALGRPCTRARPRLSALPADCT